MPKSRVHFYERNISGLLNIMPGQNSIDCFGSTIIEIDASKTHNNGYKQKFLLFVA